MQVVNGVAPVVLDMPTERGEAHAHIQPGQGHATYISCHVGQHGWRHHRHVIKIPTTVQVLLQYTNKNKAAMTKVYKRSVHIVGYIEILQRACDTSSHPYM